MRGSCRGVAVKQRKKMADQKQEVTIIVNGTPTSVTVNPHQPIISVVERVLKDSGNIGQPPDQWWFHTEDGTRVSGETRFEDLPNVQLYLSLEAGVGG